MHTSQRARLSAAILCATVWSACVIEGETLRMQSHHTSHLKPQTSAFISPSCKPFPNKRVILVTPNLEYWDMFINWLHYAKKYIRSTEQLVVFAEDQGVAQKLQNTSFVYMDLNWTLHLPPDGRMLFHADGPWGSPDFNQLTGRRPQQIAYFLRMNCTVLYTDIDSVWLGDVFQDIANAGPHKLYITDDSRGNRGTKQWQFCTCFLYLQPDQYVRRLVDLWDRHPLRHATNDQPPFNEVLRDDYGSNRSVDFAVLPYGAFPPGCSSELFWGNTTMHVLHANYIRGFWRKKLFLESHNLWAR